MFIIFFIGAIAETNRAPFDLAEAESELVSGFMTEHAAVVFVFFFLAEYSSIVLICILINVLFIGGYLSLDYFFLLKNVDKLLYNLLFINSIFYVDYYTQYLMEYSFINGIISGLSLGIKTSILVFIFI
jgi:NADH-ubiquinone oxidoreductase chain 1